MADDGAKLTIPYTYAVYFREDERVEWSKRWDMYFNNQDESTGIHWLAIINSLVICSLLTAVVAMILARTVIPEGARRNKDGIEDGKLKLRAKRSLRTASNHLEKKPLSGLLEQKDRLLRDDDDASSSDEEYIEDITGWKLLHGDVFRAPKYAFFLAPLVGSGCPTCIYPQYRFYSSPRIGLLNPSFRGGFSLRRHRPLRLQLVSDLRLLFLALSTKPFGGTNLAAPTPS